MNDVLQFAAKASEKFDKAEIYTFLAGFLGGASYFILFDQQIAESLPSQHRNFFLYLTLVVFWLFSTAAIFIFSEVILLLHGLFFRLRARRKNWAKEKEQYTKNESQVRHLNEFSQHLTGIHLLSLVASLIVLMSPLSCILADRTGVRLEVVLWVESAVFVITNSIVWQVVHVWLRLEKLCLLRAFHVTSDVPTFLQFYGIASQEAASPQQDENLAPGTRADP